MRAAHTMVLCNIIARVMGEDKSINDKLMGINGELFNGLLVGISGGKPRAGRNKEFCSSHRLSLRYGTQCAKRTCLTLHVPERVLTENRNK